MKLTILVEDNTCNDKLLAEHGLSMFIENAGKRILFDTGSSDAFIKNANRLNIDLSDLDYVVLSHGHYDHTWGLKYLLDLNYKCKSGILARRNKPTLIAHPLTFNEKKEEKRDIGSNLSKEELSLCFNLQLTQNPFYISDNLVFLGEIPRTNNFEAKTPLGQVKIENSWEDDYILDDAALVYNSGKGLVIITGCSHSGICNIVVYSKKIFNEQKILDIIGGFHLIDANEIVLKETLNYLKSQDIKQLHPCHCIDMASKTFLSKYLNIKEVGGASRLEFKFQ